MPAMLLLSWPVTWARACGADSAMSAASAHDRLKADIAGSCKKISETDGISEVFWRARFRTNARADPFRGRRRRLMHIDDCPDSQHQRRRRGHLSGMSAASHTGGQG